MIYFSVIKQTDKFKIMTNKQITSELNKARTAINNLPEEHSLAPEWYRENNSRMAGQSFNAMWATECGELTRSKLPSVLKRMQAAVQAKRQAWLIANTTYVARSMDRSKFFIVLTQEMNGKYGWFESTFKSYNLPEYFTGYILKEGVNMDEYFSIK